MPQGFAVGLPNRLLDADGNPANGWKVYTYTAGTSTPLTTYSDGQLSSANANPIIASAEGYYRAFVAQGIFVKIIVHNASDVLQFTLDNLEPMIADPSAGSVTAVPAGSMVFHGAATAPTGFLACDGSAVSRSTYSGLFAVISTTWGAGDGSTTFNLPDMRGKAAYGKAASGTGSTLGGSFGVMDHTHTGPSHTHATTIPRDGWGQTLNAPSVSGRMNTGYASGTGQFNSSYQATGDQAITSAAGGTGATSTGNPPGAAGLWCIKT